MPGPARPVERRGRPSAGYGRHLVDKKAKTPKKPKQNKAKPAAK